MVSIVAKKKKQQWTLLTGFETFLKQQRIGKNSQRGEAAACVGLDGGLG
jgi:hypothetical protein